MKYFAFLIKVVTQTLIEKELSSRLHCHSIEKNMSTPLNSNKNSMEKDFYEKIIIKTLTKSY